MHRTISISLPAGCTAPLVARLQPHPDIISLSLDRGGSLKPVGDVLTLHLLNRGGNDVLRQVAEVCGNNPYTLTTAELASLVSPAQQEHIEQDFDEALWEEMESGLSHNGRLTSNYMYLMSIGGLVAAVGLVAEPVPQAMSFVAAAVLAPGFDPLAKVSLGMLHGKKMLIVKGLQNTLLGYTVLIISAAISFWIMQFTGAATVKDFVTNHEVLAMTHPDAKQLLMSVGGALAGGLMVASYRETFITGALMAMAVIHAAAMVGVGLATGQWFFAGQGAQRFGLDALLIVGCCWLVFWGKQQFVHHRKPLV